MLMSVAPATTRNGTPGRSRGRTAQGRGAGDDLRDEYGAGGPTTMHGGTGHNALSGMAGSGSGQLISGSLATGYNVLGDNSSTAHTLQGSAGLDSLYATGSGNDVL